MKNTEDLNKAIENTKNFFITFDDLMIIQELKNIEELYIDIVDLRGNIYLIRNLDIKIEVIYDYLDNENFYLLKRDFDRDKILSILEKEKIMENTYIDKENNFTKRKRL